MKKKTYYRPKVNKMISLENTDLLAGSVQVKETPYPDAPGAKASLWDTDEEEAENRNAANGVGGSANKMNN